MMKKNKDFSDAIRNSNDSGHRKYKEVRHGVAPFSEKATCSIAQNGVC